MSSTNKTTNYNLSQFIGTDKPAWLSDYNGDMGKIDAGLNTAQSTATGADGKANANATAIGTLSSLTTEAKTNLVAAVNEVNTTAGTALNTASNAAGNATQALTKANDLAAYFALTSFTSIAANNVVPASGNVIGVTNLTVAANNTHSLGKVYGRINYQNGSADGWADITINIDSGIHPDADFSIYEAGIATNSNQSGNQVAQEVTLTFKPNGNIKVKFWADASQRYLIHLFPCLYFFTDFGDVPEAD